MTIRIGLAEVRMDGIGGVATPEGTQPRVFGGITGVGSQPDDRGRCAAVDAVRDPLYSKYGFATLGPSTRSRRCRSMSGTSYRFSYTDRDSEPGDLSAPAALPGRNGVRGGLVRRLVVGLAEAGTGPVPGARGAVLGATVASLGGVASLILLVDAASRGRPAAGASIGEAFAVDVDAAKLLAMGRRWASADLPVPTLAIPDNTVGRVALQNCRVTALCSDDAEFMGRVTGSRLDARDAARLSCGGPPACAVHGDDRNRRRARDAFRRREHLAIDAGLPGEFEVALDRERWRLAWAVDPSWFCPQNLPAAMIRLLGALSRRTLYLSGRSILVSQRPSTMRLVVAEEVHDRRQCATEQVRSRVPAGGLESLSPTI